MDIEILEGTAPRLYELVAPLVMNAAVLRLNNNYPFKTSRHHRWYVAVAEDGSVAGFVPVKEKEREACIDNYYISGDAPELLDALLGRIVEDAVDGRVLTAVVHKRHVGDFVRNGFKTVREWIKYDKMIFNSGGSDA